MPNLSPKHELHFGTFILGVLKCWECAAIPTSHFSGFSHSNLLVIAYQLVVALYNVAKKISCHLWTTFWTFLELGRFLVLPCRLL